MLKSVGIQTPDFFGLCDQYTQTEPGLFDGEAWFFNTEEEPGSENESIENVSPRKNSIFIWAWNWSDVTVPDTVLSMGHTPWLIN